MLDVRRVEMLAIIFDDDELFIYSHTECEWRKVCCLYFIRHIQHPRTRDHTLYTCEVFVCVCICYFFENGGVGRQLYMTALNKLFHIYYLIRSHLQAKRIKDLCYFSDSLKPTRWTFKCRLYFTVLILSSLNCKYLYNLEGPLKERGKEREITIKSS